MNNEQIAHDLAVAFAAHDLDEYVQKLKSESDEIPAFNKFTYLINAYNVGYVEILNEL